MGRSPKLPRNSDRLDLPDLPISSSSPACSLITLRRGFSLCIFAPFVYPLSTRATAATPVLGSSSIRHFIAFRRLLLYSITSHQSPNGADLDLHILNELCLRLGRLCSSSRRLSLATDPSHTLERCRRCNVYLKGHASAHAGAAATVFRTTRRQFGC